MDRTYPTTGFGDLGAGTGWSYERSAKASYQSDTETERERPGSERGLNSLIYGTSRPSHPDSELLHHQAYSTPHPLQGYATNHHQGSSGQGGGWGAPGQSLGLSGLFDTGLHQANPSGPDSSVMNFISALESRGPQPLPSASSLLSQFRSSTWQPEMHTSAPAELFIAGTLPGSGSFPTSSALSAYQHPASFSGRSYTPSHSLQDTSTFSTTSNGLLSPQDPLLHIQTPSQSRQSFDRLLSSHSPATSFRGVQDPTGPSTQTSASSSGHHLPHPPFNLLSSQVQDQSPRLYNTSIFSSTPGSPSELQPPQERIVPRQDSVIKHYQRTSSTQSHLGSATPHPLQHYISSGGVSGYQQMTSHHSGLTCSPLGEQSPSSEPNSQVYRPIIQTSYTSSSASSSTSGSKAAKSSSSSSGYSSSGSVSSSRTPYTPTSTSSASSCASSSLLNSAISSSLAPPRQKPPPQSAAPLPAPPSLPNVSATPAQQSQSKTCFSAYGSPVPAAKSSRGLPGQTSPQQSFSPGQPQTMHMTQSYGGFSSVREPISRTVVSQAKGFVELGAVGRSFSAEVVYGPDSGYSSLPTSLGATGTPSMGCGGPGHSPALLRSGVGGMAVASGDGLGTGRVAPTGCVGARNVGGDSGGGGSYNLHDSSPSPCNNSAIIRTELHSPTSAHPSPSPGARGNNYLPSVLSPTFLSSPRGYHEARSSPTQSYHPVPPKPKSNADMLGMESSQDEEDDEFLIQHLLQTQSPVPHSSQHHPQPIPLQQQPPQSLPQTSDGVAKGLTYEMHKASEERYHLQSVIRTNSTTNNTATGPVTSGGTSSLENQLMSLKKTQQQQAKVKRMSGTSSRGVRGAIDSHTHSHLLHSQLNDSLNSVAHYGKSDLCLQLPHFHHPHHSFHVHSPQHAHQGLHSQHPHTHIHAHPHVEQKKTTDSSDIIPCLCKTPDLQQADQPQQPPSARVLPSFSEHTSSNKIESMPPSKQNHQPHPRHQHAMIVRGLDPHPESHSQLQLESHAMDARYGRRAQLQDQSQVNQNSMSPLDMLEQSLSQANNLDSGGMSKAVGNVGLVVGGGEEQQHHILSAHQPHQSQQTTASDLHNFLSEPDMGLSPPSHLHHLNVPQQHNSHPHAHPHHQLSHSHLGHSHQLVPSVVASQQQPQHQLSQSHLDQHKGHQFDTVSPVGKAAQSQVRQQKFVPPTSNCFPDSFLQDEGRSFFHGIDDIFCAEDYKSSCSGGTSVSHVIQEDISEECSQVQEGIEAIKAAGVADGFELMGHHTDQEYGQYCHDLLEPENGSLHLDLDSLKTHELPSTVNTEQLGLIQSQTTGLLMGGMVNKIIGGQGVGGISGTESGLTSPIFCSSRSKKLLKTSSFHLLKRRRQPMPPTIRNYAQEYEFEDDEDKADVPADIRLNSRRLPDLLPDLVSSCRKGGAAPDVGCLSPVMGEFNFCHPTGYSTLGPPPLLLPHNGPKKRGRKPTKPKREGPPRPRGRPRIRPLPELPYCRGIMGVVGRESTRGRGRGRGRGKKDDGMAMHRDISKIRNLQYQQQLHQQHHHQHHTHYLQPNHQIVPPLSPQQQHPHHQQPQQHLHHPHQQQPLHQQQQQQLQLQQPWHKEHIGRIKIKQPIPSVLPTNSLLKTDSLSSNDPVLSDGLLGLATSPSLSPGPTSGKDLSRTAPIRTQEKMKQKTEETDDKSPELKPGLITSFLDFLKSVKKEHIRVAEPTHDDTGDSDALKGKMRPLSTPPPAAPLTQPTAFSEGADGEACLVLSNCPSPCKRLDEELKRNLETLPSFSSDEEDSVSKNQDLQMSISSAISALYDMPNSRATATAALAAPAPPTPSPPTTPAQTLSLPLPVMHLAAQTTLKTKDTDVEVQTHTQSEAPPNAQPLKPLDKTEVMNGEEEQQELGKSNVAEEEEVEERLNGEPDVEHRLLKKDEEKREINDCQANEEFRDDDSPPEAHFALKPASPSLYLSTTSSSSSPSPLTSPPLSFPSPLPIQQDHKQEEQELTFPQQRQPCLPLTASPLTPSASTTLLSTSCNSILPPTSVISSSSSPATPIQCSSPPPASNQVQDPEPGQPSSSSSSYSLSPPSSPLTPDDALAPRISSLHLAKKQTNAAIAGQSEEEDSESGGEGIFRERDEFVVRSEDISMLKMALQTGREPPPIWRVQKALLQKFSPEIKDGQRQFCATSNYLGYFGDAKMRYQRLYVKFLENVNKKDYVRVCSRKPWHRPGLTMRRQSLPKPPPPALNQTSPRIEKERGKEKHHKELYEKEREQKVKEEREYKDKKEQIERELKERELKEKEQEEKENKEESKHRERERREVEKEREQKDSKQREREKRDIEQKVKETEKERERERIEKEKGREKEQKEREQERESSEREKENERAQKESMLRESELLEKEKKHELKERDWREREQKTERALKERREREQDQKGSEWRKTEQNEKEQELKERECRERKKEHEREKQHNCQLERKERMEKEWKHHTSQESRAEQGRLKGESRVLERKRQWPSKAPRPINEKAEPPPKKRKKWLKKVPSASDSEADQSSEDEGPVRVGLNSRAMREMFRSYVEMLVSTALDPDMIQALEDTDDELYLPPMRKIDNLLNEQKRRLLRRVTMNTQHLEAMHMFPKMTADRLDSGTVRAHLSGDGYNRKTLNRIKRSMPKQQDLKLSSETWQIYSIYHSLHHYKYHTLLQCQKETNSIEQAADDPGQEEVVQQCMANHDCDLQHALERFAAEYEAVRRS